jgi:hypothetical protein
MKDLIKRRLEAFDRIADFGSNHTLTPALALATELYTQVGTIVTDIRTHEGVQRSGFGDYLGGTERRKQAREGVLAKMRPMNRIARALDREQYPEARAQFKMPSRGGYEGIIGQAEAFLAALPTMKAVFIDYGLAADFDEQLQSAKADLIAATDRKYNGRIAQASGTAGLLAKSKEGMKVVRQLDGIMSAKYESDPALLAGWKAACRVEKAAKRSGGTGAAAGGNNTGTGGGTTASGSTGSGGGTGGNSTPPQSTPAA